MVAAAGRVGVKVPATATDLGAATVADVAALLQELATHGSVAPNESTRIDGVAPWIAEYEEVWTDVGWPSGDEDEAERWHTCELSEGREANSSAGATHAVIVLPLGGARGDDKASAHNMWLRVRHLRESAVKHLAIVHAGVAVRGFARSLLAEGAFDQITLIDNSRCPENWAAVRKLLSVRRGAFSCWRIKENGDLQSPRLMRKWMLPEGNGALSHEDCLLVTGGARGIGAECALRLGEQSGARLVLAGRSDPESHEVRTTLERARTLGILVRYEVLDVCSKSGCEKLQTTLAAEGWAPTAMCHAAGVNTPKRLDEITARDLDAVLAPKIVGLSALLDAFGHELRLVVGFGSIIGALGLAGESHYALANDMMSEQLTDWAQDHDTRAIALDWSIWAGAGMGERLGVVERLRSDGVDALPLDAALDRLETLVLNSKTSGRIIVTSRFGPPKDVVELDAVNLPILRFVGHPIIHFPRTELIVDADLSIASDPWLADHVVDGNAVVPGVLLMEAMAQVANALSGKAVSSFENMHFERAVVAPDDKVTLRICALQCDDPEKVDVVIRSSEDGFAADRARARIGLGSLPVPDQRVDHSREMPHAADLLYDVLWFNAGIFKRLRHIGCASAFSASGDLSLRDISEKWFGGYAPQTLLLGDPGARDAGLHLLQVCAPQLRVVPVSVASVRRFEGGTPRTVSAQERWSDDRLFCFDVIWCDDEGRVVEEWSQATFKALGPIPVADLPDFMLPAILERSAAMTGVSHDLRMVVEPGPDRAERRARCLERLDVEAVVTRADGKPLPTGDQTISLSHIDNLSLAAASGSRKISCDMMNGAEPPEIAPDDQNLRKALATQGVVEARVGAVIWTARECLRKAGASFDSPLSLLEVMPDGVVVLRGAGNRLFSISLATELTATVLVNTARDTGARAGDKADLDRRI